MWINKQRLKDIETRIKKLERATDCVQGMHVWGAGTCVQTREPYIRCNYCFTAYPKENKQ